MRINSSLWLSYKFKFWKNHIFQKIKYEHHHARKYLNVIIYKIIPSSTKSSPQELYINRFSSKSRSCVYVRKLTQPNFPHWIFISIHTHPSHYTIIVSWKKMGRGTAQSACKIVTNHLAVDLILFYNASPNTVTCLVTRLAVVGNSITSLLALLAQSRDGSIHPDTPKAFLLLSDLSLIFATGHIRDRWHILSFSQAATSHRFQIIPRCDFLRNLLTSGNEFTI